MVEEILSELGLNRREIICYTALLELGSSRVGLIVKKTNIPSSKIYEVLERLIGRGLVSYVIIKNVRNYQAADPKTLLNHLEDKKRRLNAIMPKLLLKQSMSSRQSVEIFEGQKAVFTLFTDLIVDAKSKEEYLVFSIDEENKNDNANLFFRNLALRRKEKKLDVKLLKNQKIHKLESHTKLELKFTRFNLPQGITIFRDHVIILSWTNSPVAIKIQSKQLADQWKGFFHQLWKESKE